MILAAVLALSLTAHGRVLELYVDGSLTADQRDGIALSVREAGQTATLLGATVRITPVVTPSTIGVISVGSAAAAAVPVVRLDTRAPAGRCEFSVHAASETTSWQPTLTRFGASELNERFARHTGRPMTSDAWEAWFAVKLLVESALRADGDDDPCDIVLRGRYDGHKGTPLTFDPATRILRQPLYPRAQK